MMVTLPVLLCTLGLKAWLFPDSFPEDDGTIVTKRRPCGPQIADQGLPSINNVGV
jgi:hypothetical protein